MTMTRQQLLPFVVVAWVGVGTTLINTSLPLFFEGPGMIWWRDLVMLIHAPATLIPVVGVAILSWRASPFLASTAIAVTLVEKSLEFVGQSLRLFPPEENLGGVAVADIVAAIWDQLFFVLWSCNTIGATCVGIMLWRLLGGVAGWLAAVAAWLAGALTLLLIMGPDYVNFLPSLVPALLFVVAFTAYRAAMAATLQWYPQQAPSGDGSKEYLA